MKKLLVSSLLSMIVIGCGKFEVNPPSKEKMPETLFVVQSAIVSLNSYGEVAFMNRQKEKPTIVGLLLPNAKAQVQASGVVSVTYSRPGVTSFTLDTTGFMAGSYPSVTGEDLNLGSIAVSALDDNSLRVCTGVGAPSNKCNRLYIRVFTTGSNISNSITGVAGFINTDMTPSYGLPVLAGSVLTPLGFNSNANAPSVTDAANVLTYTIPGNMNRVRLTNTGAINFPVKADITNAGAGNYEMRLVVQYALGYVP